MVRSITALALLGTLGCSDYELANKDKPANGSGSSTSLPTTTSATTTTPTTSTSTSYTSTTTPATVPCTGFDAAWDWWGSPPFDFQADWTDAAGVPYWDPAHQLVDYSTVVLPGQNIPTGFDKAYVSWFDLPDPAPVILLDIQSDDGIWIYVNGSFVGHWGGDWQLEGCVNENANCIQTVAVPPVDISSFVVPGSNVIAARVSNPVLGSWFEVGARCIE